MSYVTQLNTNTYCNLHYCFIVNSMCCHLYKFQNQKEIRSLLTKELFFIEDIFVSDINN
jgi:hypothetical protein